MKAAVETLTPYAQDSRTQFVPRDTTLLTLGDVGGKTSWGRQRMRWLDGRTNSRDTSSVQSLSRVRLFVTPWTTACQASLSIINSQSLPKLMSIESVMPSNHLILYRPLLLLPSIFPSIRVSSSESVLRIRRPKDWSFSFNTSPSNEHSELISFRTDVPTLPHLPPHTKNILTSLAVPSKHSSTMTKKSTTPRKHSLKKKKKENTGNAKHTSQCTSMMYFPPKEYWSLNQN